MKALLVATAALLLALCGLAAAEITQKGDVRVSFDGRIAPKALPRHGQAPVKVEVETKVAGVGAKASPQLTRISIAINRHGRLEPKGLPTCELSQIQPATSEKALEACRGALVGKGSFEADVSLPEQSAYPSEGEMLAFNGSFEGKPAILAHVYGTEPVPTSFTLPFVVSQTKGVFATVLTAKLPADAANSVTGLQLTLQRRFSVNGKARSYAAAGCPAPKGFPGAVFPFARASYEFAGGRRLSSTLTRSCKARG